MTLKELAELAMEEKKLEYPNLPAHAIPKIKFSDKTANELTKSILTFFKLKKIKAWRQASEGRFIQEKSEYNVLGHKVVTQKGKYIPRGKDGGKGAGDIQAVIPPYGRTMHIEVKIGKDRQRESQKVFQAELEGMGGIYILVKTWDDFYSQVSLYLKNT